MQLEKTAQTEGQKDKDNGEPGSPPSGHRWCDGERYALRGQQTCGQILVPPFTSYVTGIQLIILASVCSSVNWGPWCFLTELLWISKWNNLYKVHNVSFACSKHSNVNALPSLSKWKVSQLIKWLSPPSTYCSSEAHLSFLINTPSWWIRSAAQPWSQKIIIKHELWSFLASWLLSLSFSCRKR